MNPYKRAKLNDRNNDLSKNWYVEYQYLHPETKQWVRYRTWISSRLKTGTARREKAAEICKNLNAWLISGGNPFARELAGCRLLKDSLLYILSIKESNCRRRTYHTYKHVIMLFFKFLDKKKLSGITIEDMSSSIAQEFMDWTKLEHGVQNRTHNYYLMDISTFFNELVSRNLIAANPFKGIKKLEAEETSIVAFKKSELELVKTKLKEDDKILYCIAGLIFYCALRPAEIMRLKVADLYLEQGVVHVNGGQAKNKKNAWVNIMNKDFIEDLKSLNLEVYPEEFFIFTRHLKPGIKEAAPTRIAERWRKWANENNIKRNIYDLKHTAAGLANDNGVPLRDLQLHFRHSELSITEKYLQRFRRVPGPGLLKYPSF
jgi:integrase